MEDFGIGDVVYLKSGSQAMVVSHVGENETVNLWYWHKDCYPEKLTSIPTCILTKQIRIVE